MARSRALILHGYGPLVAFLVFFALMVSFVPTVGPDTQTAGEGAPGTTAGGSGVDEAAGGGPRVPDDTGAVADGQRSGGDGASSAAPDDAPSATDEGAGANPAPEGGSNGSSGSNGAGDSGGSGSSARGAQTCPDRELQVPGDPYSPPCVTFSGDNGGATSRGVTGDEIVLSMRTPEGGGYQATLANQADTQIGDTPEDLRRTLKALVVYFNDRFELYGRELTVETYEGQGDPTSEVMGEGHERAQADALTVADEIGAFAEINGGTQPFSEALAQNGVIALGALHFSEQWHTEYRPYTWSGLVDCSTVSRAQADWENSRLRGYEAEYAGSSELRGRVRTQVTVMPENPVYTQCAEDGRQAAREAGHEPPAVTTYTLDPNTMSNQAANIIAELQHDAITTVTCACDPLMLTFLTARAQEQDYHPEWIVTGSGYSDQDAVGQLLDQEQWSRAFGISFSGQPVPMQGSLGYHAYKQVRDDEPASQVNALYYTLYLLVIGIQGAGPELTPETFEQGMFDYPGGSGPAGTWRFGPGNYTAPEDYREIYWDPQKTSEANGQPGAYVDLDPGTRHLPGEAPQGPPDLPR